MTTAVDAFAAPALLALIAGLILWDRRRHHKPTCVADGLEDEPYRVYTNRFDMTVFADELPGCIVGESPDRMRGWLDNSGREWRRAESLAEQERIGDDRRLELAHRAQSLQGCSEIAAVHGDTLVTFLVDQSGSMKGRPMAAACGALDAVIDVLRGIGISVELLGFSTVGWHGGKSRLQWKNAGGPRRPGRLCALLHIIYLSAGQSHWSASSRRAMMCPDILRENVDGEALRWAAQRSREALHHRKALIIVSDGAPVDDATLMHNGPSYLDRDLRRAIRDIENAEDVRLGAIGVQFDVSRYYRNSQSAPLDRLPEAIIDQVMTLLDDNRFANE